ARARRTTLEGVIRSTGFYRNKAKSLIGMAKTLDARFGGEGPRTMDEMLELPGVARKTANVVPGSAYAIPAGAGADTHVAAAGARVGLTREKDPKKIERDLRAILPAERWVSFAHQLIWHGRRVCAARKPLCERCPLPCPSRLRPFQP